MRMISGLLAAQQGKFTLIGDASLTRRPMERIRKPSRRWAPSITLTDGHAPVTITAARCTAIDYTTPVPSAQVKTAVLFAGLQTAGTTTVRESVRTRDHSELALRAFGAELTRSFDSVSIAGAQTFTASMPTVPGDLSSAAFFLCAAALFPDSSLVLDQLGLNPTRATLLDVLTFARRAHQRSAISKRSTANLSAPCRSPLRAKAWEPPPSRGALAAQLIDELPVLAAIAPYTRGGIRIRDAKELRVKESDRIALVARICAPWAPRWKSSKMASMCPAASNFTAPRSTPAAITASPWPSPSRPCAPKARASSTVRTQPPSASRSSSTCSTWSPNDSFIHATKEKSLIPGAYRPPESDSSFCSALYYCCCCCCCAGAGMLGSCVFFGASSPGMMGAEDTLPTTASARLMP